MHLTAQARIFLPGEDVFRKPTFWDKVGSFFGGEADLRTGEIQLTQDVLALTEQIQQALGLAKIKNAVTLVIDQDVIYQDLDDIDNDADLLVKAARENAPRFIRGFQVLRAVFEHEADGLHALIEITVRAKAKKTEPTATVSVGARIQELRPKEDESLEDAKERIGRALGNAQLVPTYRNALNNLMNKIGAGLQRVFASGRVEVDPADAQVVRPSGQDVRALGQSGGEQRDADLLGAPNYPGRGGYGPYYDPWCTYYRDPMDTFVNLMILDALISPHRSWGYGPGWLGSQWSSYGAPVTVINYNGQAYGNASDALSYSDRLGNVHDTANMDFEAAHWDDSQMASYDAGDSSWGTGGGNGTFDCAGGSSGGFDCAGADSGSSDCSADCSSDCSWDCSSDCSSDCSFDCGGD